MDLNRIAVFVSVVERGGFSAAAKSLGLPKSSVSRSVALLEKDLGVRLLHRSTRKVSLTNAGQAFYERAASGVGALQRATSDVSDMDAAMRGTIRLTVPVDAGVWLVAPVVAAFVKRHPHVYVDVQLTSRVVDLVEEGVDLALRAGRVTTASLIARKLGSIDSALYASRRYVERRGTPETVADLAAHPAVMFRPTDGRVTWNLVGPRGATPADVTGPVSSDDFSFVRRAVMGGVGIGRLPLFLCAHAVKRGTVVRVLPAYRIPGAPLQLVYASARHPPQRVAALRDALIEGIRRRIAKWG
jgi:DNA-binding transcriptional LysR family regulator